MPLLQLAGFSRLVFYKSSMDSLFIPAPIRTHSGYYNSTIVGKTMWVGCRVLAVRKDFLIMKPTRCTNFSNLFWNETPHVSDSFSVHHQEIFTVHSAMEYVIQVCRQLSSSRNRMDLQFHPHPAARKLSTNLYNINH
jgi:hypothetical protein